MTATLFLLQPLARLAGRLRNGLSPWRRRLRPGAAWPRPRTVKVWSESLARAPGSDPGPPGRARGERRLRAKRRSLRSLGPRSARGPARRRQDPHRGRGARLGQAADAGEDLAAGLRRSLSSPPCCLSCWGPMPGPTAGRLRGDDRRGAPLRRRARDRGHRHGDEPCPGGAGADAGGGRGARERSRVRRANGSSCRTRRSLACVPLATWLARARRRCDGGPADPTDADAREIQR